MMTIMTYLGNLPTIALILVLCDESHQMPVLYRSPQFEDLDMLEYDLLGHRAGHPPVVVVDMAISKRPNHSSFSRHGNLAIRRRLNNNYQSSGLAERGTEDTIPLYCQWAGRLNLFPLTPATWQGCCSVVILARRSGNGKQ